MRIVKLTVLALLFLPFGATARYGRWEGRGHYNNYQLNQLAEGISHRADDLWGMVYDWRQFRDPQRAYIYYAVGNLAHEAHVYRSNMDECQASRLISMAEDIGCYVDQNQLPYDFLIYWAAVAREVSSLCRYYEVPFEWDRSLAQTDPYCYGCFNNYDHGNRDMCP